MSDEIVILDSDTLSLLSRGDTKVTARATQYLNRHGRLTITSVTVFERFRGYYAAIRDGKPFEAHLRTFQALVEVCHVLPLDGPAAEVAARAWSELGRKAQRHLGDILIAAIASANGRPLVSRNVRDFKRLAALESIELNLLNWAS